MLRYVLGQVVPSVLKAVQSFKILEPLAPTTHHVAEDLNPHVSISLVVMWTDRRSVCNSSLFFTTVIVINTSVTHPDNTY
jgi:hypothetical protein